MEKKAKQEKRKILTDKEIAMDFALRVQQKFDRLVKASILFGSQAKETSTSKSDIDIILIVDDASVNWDMELIAWYRHELGKLISAKDYNKELHINTVKLTTWWQDLTYGDPVVLNILRYGEALVDLGSFFTPLKALLERGKIRSTPEAVYVALQKAPSHLARSKMAIIGAVEGIYWAMVDSAQAALITAGKVPPSPEKIPEMLHETFVEKKILSNGYVRAFSDLFAIHKKISHGNFVEIKGEEIDKWQNVAKDFLEEMTDIINKILDTKKDFNK